MKKLTISILLVLSMLLISCDAAQVASHNISKAADNFEIQRRVVFFNGITDKYLLVIEGYCSLRHGQSQLEVTCKLGKDKYKKHFLGLSDNVSYLSEHVGDGDPISESHYRVVFKPSVLVPNIDFK